MLHGLLILGALAMSAPSAAAEAEKARATTVAPSPGAQTTGPTWIWWEAEDAVEHNFPADGAHAPANAEEQDKLSNRAWLQHHRGAGLTARWEINVPEGGKFAFWTRKFWKHGPFQWRWNGADRRVCGRDVALADNVSLRLHLGANWVYLGEVDLPSGKNLLEIEVLPEASAAAFDCWLLTKTPFLPDGANKPGTKYARAEEGWFAFEPDADGFRNDAPLDLRFLNQKRAGDDGYVRARGDDFVFEKTGRPVRFWAVNASRDFDDPAAARYLARRLAKLGINLVRLHGRIWDASAPDLRTIDKRALDQIHRIVAAMADEGIYTALSFYFPLWVSMKDEYGFPGYKKGDHPFALLFFHPDFQETYKSWVKALMTSQNPYTSRSLADDPAVAMVEIANEDNFLFWTFKPGQNPPAEIMALLEEAFGRWVVKKHGSFKGALEVWGPEKAPKGDDFARGRVALYGAGHLTNQGWAVQGRNQKRASDQLQFLTEFLRQFYADMTAWLRKEAGVKCSIIATNWKTADAKTLGALDKYANMACDVLDRHAYFGSSHEGEGASYSLRTGHTYRDTTGLFAPASLTREVQYTGHPHIVSEYNHPPPNRFRAECPWLAAAYGRLTGTDGILFFALSQADWERFPPKFSIFTPAVMGQFPAAALIYRSGYVREGPVVADFTVRRSDLYEFKGTPAWEDMNLDELRKADLPEGAPTETMPADFDPLAFLAGRVTMTFSDDQSASKVADLSPWVDRGAKVVRSATGELTWDYGKGRVTLNASHAQGACGFLGQERVELADVALRIENEYGAILVVSLDGKPLADSERMLVQAVTEDRGYNWQTEEAQVKGQAKKRIVNLGAPPVVVKNIAGAVAFKRPDAARMRVTALDFNGYTRQALAGGADDIRLLPDCLYYIVSR